MTERPWPERSPRAVSPPRPVRPPRRLSLVGQCARRAGRPRGGPRALESAGAGWDRVRGSAGGDESGLGREAHVARGRRRGRAGSGKPSRGREVPGDEGDGRASHARRGGRGGGGQGAAARRSSQPRRHLPSPSAGADSPSTLVCPLQTPLGPAQAPPLPTSQQPRT